MSFRENPAFDTYEALQELGIGEALISVLDENGVPTVVQRCKILPPQSQMGAIDETIRGDEIKNDLLYTRYMEMVDRDSAYEFLMRKSREDAEAALRMKEENEAEALRQKQAKNAVKGVAKTAAGTIGREIGNGVGKTIGGSFGKRLGGNIGASLGRGLLDTLFKR